MNYMNIRKRICNISHQIDVIIADLSKLIVKSQPSSCNTKSAWSGFPTLFHF